MFDVAVLRRFSAESVPHPTRCPGDPFVFTAACSGSMLGATFTRVGRGIMSKVDMRTATVPASIAGGRAMSVWSEMPMGPADPILGLTGEQMPLL